jgi:hypothetical protein
MAPYCKIPMERCGVTFRRWREDEKSPSFSPNPEEVKGFQMSFQMTDLAD